MDIDFPLIGVIFCFSIIIIGQFFLLNLILAVIIRSFSNTSQKRLEEEIKNLEREKAEEMGDSNNSEVYGAEDFYVRVIYFLMYGFISVGGKQFA
jgi:hypothetical protein